MIETFFIADEKIEIPLEQSRILEWTRKYVESSLLDISLGEFRFMYVTSAPSASARTFDSPEG